MLKKQWLAAFIIFIVSSWFARSSRDLWENMNPQLAIAWNALSFLFLTFGAVCFFLMLLEKEGW